MTPWTIAPGMMIRRSMTSVTTAAKWLFCGDFRAWLAISGNANVGPNTMIAPRTWRNSSSCNIGRTPSSAAAARMTWRDGRFPGRSYDRRLVRRWTKSTRTYSPRCSGSA